MNTLIMMFSDARIRGTDDPEKRDAYFHSRGASYKSLVIIILILIFSIASLSVVAVSGKYEATTQGIMEQRQILNQVINQIHDDLEHHVSPQSKLHETNTYMLNLTAKLQLMNQEITSLKHTVFNDRTEAIEVLNDQVRALRKAISQWRIRNGEEPAQGGLEKG